ncbi:MAG: type IV pilus assembly protein PilQ [Kiritimatiellia bacterium]|jgi:type IV pilus assembly protein PilQ
MKRLVMVTRQSIVFYTFMFVACYASAAIDLQEIQFSELPGNRVEVKTTFSSPPNIPTGYAIEKPARIVLDFPNVSSVLKQKKYSLGLGNLKSSVVLTAKGRTRIILNLSSSASYDNVVQGNTLITTIDSAVVANKTFTGAQEKTKGVPLSSGALSSSVNAITAIDFRRHEDGSGKILLTLSNPKISVDVEKNANNINIMFADTTISEVLQRRLDVIDFATPVKFIETRLQGGKVNISVESEGQYDYLAYQADGVYVVSISPLTGAEIEEQKKRFKFVGEKLSLNFQDIEVRKVLEIIADFTELNLVASDTVSGNITLRLENVPWDQALELVLKSKGLDKRQSGNVLLVAPAAEIAERERQELESKKQLQELEPLSTEFIRVRYAKAADVYALISGSGGSADGQAAVKSVLSSRGSAVVDERTNSIILTDIAENVVGIKALIEKVDVPVRQVMIEARIVTATDTFRKELGLALDASDAALGGGVNTDGDFETGSGLFTNAGDGSDFALNYLSGNIDVGLEIKALENAGYGEVVSQPRILTGDKQTAKIESGQQIPFTSSDGDTVTTIFQDAVLSLEVTPQITPDNRIIMKLKVNRDSLDTGTITLSGSPINVTELTTTVLVADGDTIVLGGIFEQTISSSESKVPLLGDIPVLGRLFRSNTEVNDKTELLIFITPRIITDTLIDN